MSYFLKSGNKFKVTTKAALDLHEQLPVGTYTVGQDPCSGQFFLEKIDSFHLPKKLYGSTSRHCDRILTTFLDRTASTGVLLTGEKGSGKTLLAKVIAVEAAERYQVPTIVVNRDWCGEDFNTFVQLINQPAIILFDEFEKVYDSEKQEMMLTLLDGVYPSKKLFILTCNDKWRIDSNMRNRPGRVYYSLDFTGLEEAAIRGYCEDNLNAKQNIPAVCAISHLFSAFNFDMLKAIVEEMNRYNESPGEVLKFLNCRPSYGDDLYYQVKSLVVDGEDYVTSEKFEVNAQWHGNPMKESIRTGYHNTEDYCHYSEEFTAENLSSLDAKTGAYTFVNRKGSKVVLAPDHKKFHLNYAALSSIKATVTSMDVTGSDDSASINIPMISDIE